MVITFDFYDGSIGGTAHVQYMEMSEVMGQPQIIQSLDSFFLIENHCDDWGFPYDLRNRHMFLGQNWVPQSWNGQYWC